jgi:hypothetical protein
MLSRPLPQAVLTKKTQRFQSLRFLFFVDFENLPRDLNFVFRVAAIRVEDLDYGHVIILSARLLDDVHRAATFFFANVYRTRTTGKISGHILPLGR